MTYPEHRTPQMIMIDNARAKPDNLIEAYNHGWEWHDEKFPLGGNTNPIEAMMTSPYTLFDATDEGNEFWRGFEAATLTQLSEWIQAGSPRDENGRPMAVLDPVAEAEGILREGED